MTGISGLYQNTLGARIARGEAEVPKRSRWEVMIDEAFHEGKSMAALLEETYERGYEDGMHHIPLARPAYETAEPVMEVDD